MKKLIALVLFASALVVAAFAVPQPVASGQTITLTASADGTQPFTYQWMKGTTVLAETSSVLVLPNASIADAATYTVKILNDFGVASTSIEISIGQPPTNPKITLIAKVIAWIKGFFKIFV